MLDWVFNLKEIKKNVKWKNGIVVMIFNLYLFFLSIYYVCGNFGYFFKFLMKVEIKYMCIWSKLESKSKFVFFEIWIVLILKVVDCNIYFFICILKLNISKFICI